MSSVMNFSLYSSTTLSNSLQEASDGDTSPGDLLRSPAEFFPIVVFMRLDKIFVGVDRKTMCYAHANIVGII